MPTCVSCRNKFGFLELREGMCKSCRERVADENKSAEDASHRAKLAIGNVSDIPNHILDEQAARIIVTTGSEVPNREITLIVDVIGAEAALGLSIFKDIANNWRDFVGGRSATTQSALKEARIACLSEIRREAFFLGADAVIGVKFDFSDMPTAGGNGILFVAATGTAVKLGSPP